MNQAKNLNLDTKHAAAQLHKCPVALQQKNIRKLQLASTRVFTTPIQKGDERLNKRTIDIGAIRTTNGHQEQRTLNNSRKKNRSRSRTGNSNSSQNMSQREAGLPRYEERKENSEKLNEENPCVQRAINLPRPQYNDGWQVVRRKKQASDNNERGRGSLSQAGINSNRQMEVEEEDELTINDAQIDDNDE